MLKGTVKWFDNKRGMGFINPPPGLAGDILLHHSEVEREFNGEFVRLHEGDELMFMAVMTAKGLKAVKVRRV
jgi:cold shock CspA family protein